MPDIGGAGAVGIAFETAIGTYVAPTQWIPIRSESLQKVEDKMYRMNIRALADRTPGPQSNYRIEGDIEFEVTRDNLLYFLYAARLAPAKSGADPYTYTFTPVATAFPTTGSGATARKTLSILVKREDEGFGYVGCVVTGFSITFDNEMMIATVNIVGRDEASQSVGAQTWPTTMPYGPEDNEIQLPAASARTDIAGNVTFTVNDGGAAEHRMDGSRAPAWVRWGEREVTLSIEHDFADRTEYNTFLNQTQQNIIILGSRSATNDQVKFTIRGTIADSYEVTLPGLGDLVTASIEYHGTYSAADIYEVEIKTTANIT